jgi:guanylate kinase
MCIRHLRACLPRCSHSQHGQHYYFTTKEQFAKEIAEGRFLEYAEVHGNLYGTSRMAVRRVLDTGKVCILDIDVQGARNVRKAGLDGLFVFVAPPSLEDLARRLVGRGTETAEQVERRLGNAKAEINRWGPASQQSPHTSRPSHSPQHACLPTAAPAA